MNPYQQEKRRKRRINALQFCSALAFFFCKFDFRAQDPDKNHQNAPEAFLFFAQYHVVDVAAILGPDNIRERKILVDGFSIAAKAVIPFVAVSYTHLDVYKRQIVQ